MTTTADAVAKVTPRKWAQFNWEDPLLLDAMADRDHVKVTVFSLLVAATVKVMSDAGGTRALVEQAPEESPHALPEPSHPRQRPRRAAVRRIAVPGQVDAVRLVRQLEGLEARVALAQRRLEVGVAQQHGEVGEAPVNREAGVADHHRQLSVHLDGLSNQSGERAPIREVDHMNARSSWKLLGQTFETRSITIGQGQASSAGRQSPSRSRPDPPGSSGEQHDAIGEAAHGTACHIGCSLLGAVCLVPPQLLHPAVSPAPGTVAAVAHRALLVEVLVILLGHPEGRRG